MLPLENLNNEEVALILKTIRDFTHEFHLPGDKIDFTNAATQKIVTTDE